MTTKTDQGSGAPEPTARSADLTSDDDRRPVDSLPSIIVDPSAFAAAAQPREDERNADSLQTNGEAAGPAPEPHEAHAPAQNGSGHAQEHGSGDDAQPGSDDRLSDEEAERFAEHFRPSWHSLPAVVAAPVQPKARVVMIAPDPTDTALDSVLPRRQRRRQLITVGVAVCSFVALTALAMMSASHDAPPDQDAKASDPSEPKPATGPSAAPPAVPTRAPAATAPADPVAVAPTVPATAVPTDQPVPLTADPTPAAPIAPAALAAAPVDPAPATAIAAPTLQPEPAAAPEAVPAQATTVRIQLKTVPTSATLLIDGTPVANPFDVAVAKSGKHRVQAEAPGYRETDFTLNFDRPRDLSLRLQKVRVARKAAARRAAAARAPVSNREPAKFSVRPTSDPTPEPVKPAPVAPKPAKGAGFVSESPY
ncbi:MAG TPA: hypothetical protein VK509_05560 [Polyangiales bacterium]|nr:hypothetical protein [Polyangiales bacterium]